MAMRPLRHVRQPAILWARRRQWRRRRRWWHESAKPNMTALGRTQVDTERPGAARRRTARRHGMTRNHHLTTDTRRHPNTARQPTADDYKLQPTQTHSKRGTGVARPWVWLTATDDTIRYDTIQTPSRAASGM